MKKLHSSYSISARRNSNFTVEYSINGTVENITDKTLKGVRVEIHLSNGGELGPTTPASLDPGEKRNVELTATGKEFYWWTAHPEVRNGEHGDGEEHG